MLEDDGVDPFMAQWPLADITPGEFEVFVAEFFEHAATAVEDLVVTPHDKITGADGTYDFDASLRFTFGGMRFLVVCRS